MDKVVAFEGKNELVAKWSFRVVGKRPPKKGEFYLSGAIPQAYKARTDFLTSEYMSSLSPSTGCGRSGCPLTPGKKFM